MPTEKHDVVPLAGALAHALALRHMHIAAQLAHRAESDKMPVEDTATWPSYTEIERRYVQKVDEYLTGGIKSLREAMALVEFANAITAETWLHDALRDVGPVVSDETDRNHVAIALAQVSVWLNEQDVAEFLRTWPRSGRDAA